MRVVFLDFDGVINSAPFLQKVQHAGMNKASDAIDPRLVARLNVILAATGARVVVSSSWRHGKSRTTLQGILADRGFRGLIIGKTPDFVPNTDALSKRHTGERGDEIAYWLQQHPEVTSYVVLDDQSDMTAVRDRFIQTDPQVGLTDDHVTLAIAMLA